MIDTYSFLDKLQSHGFGKIAGVPCSFLDSLINAAEERGIYEPFVNEGDAVAYAAGCSLAGQKCAVLMQNSGLTNALSPLSSLTELFGLHTLLIIGNRGEDDEPQHRLMAGAVIPILKSLNIPFFNAGDGETAVSSALAALGNHSAALLVNRRDTFATVKRTLDSGSGLPLRYDILKAISDCAGDSIICATTGFTSRELYCVQDRPENFYMVGSMGCLSSLAMGIAESLPHKKIIAIDGDSACLMRLGALYTLTRHKPQNLCYMVLDNQSNESTGGQPNIRGENNLEDMMSALHETMKAATPDETAQFLNRFQREGGYTQIYMRIKTGSLENLPRPDRQLIFDQARRFTESVT